MKRYLLITLATVGLAGLGACNKPGADECKQAIANMQRLLGTSTPGHTENNDGEVRRCKGGSSREAVACAIRATTSDELKACQFMTPKKPAP